MTLKPGKTKARRKQVILVLGMHRSGTSAISRALLALGVELGDKLMPPGPDNERGYWEDTEIMVLNDKILAALGADYHNLALIDPASFTDGRLAGLEKAALKLLRRKLKGSSRYGIKDPRIPRLLPFWRKIFEALDVEVHYVIALRNPRSVADSLRTRNGFAREKSYLLWLEHLIPAMLQTEGAKRLIADYDRLMKRPEPELRRIAKAFEIEPDRAGIDDYIAGFLTEDLRHTRYRPKDLAADPAAPQAVIDAYALLRRAARDEISIDGGKLKRFFDGIEATLGTMTPIIAYLQKLDRTVRPTDQPG